MTNSLLIIYYFIYLNCEGDKNSGTIDEIVANNVI